MPVYEFHCDKCQRDVTLRRHVGSASRERSEHDLYRKSRLIPYMARWEVLTS